MSRRCPRATLRVIVTSAITGDAPVPVVEAGASCGRIRWSRRAGPRTRVVNPENRGPPAAFVLVRAFCASSPTGLEPVTLRNGMEQEIIDFLTEIDPATGFLDQTVLVGRP